MPVLNEKGLEEFDLPDSHYGYSAARVEDLGATEYTVVTVACDVSGSTEPFIFDMEAAVARIAGACRLSPRADNLLLRVVEFDNTLRELHGFRPLERCDASDYAGALRAGGSTALYDAAENAASATAAYARRLCAGSFSANAILFVITDGADNASKSPAARVREALASAVESEALESFVSILVGVNVRDAGVAKCLREFYREAGFTQYVELDSADAATIARLAEFVSRSVLAQSRALGAGGASLPLHF